VARYSAVVETLRGFPLIAGRAGWRTLSMAEARGRWVSELLDPRGPMAGIPFDRCPERHPRRALETPKASPFALLYRSGAGEGNRDSTGDVLGGRGGAGEAERTAVEGTLRSEPGSAYRMRHGSCGLSHPTACMSAFRRWFWVMIYKLRGVYPDAEAWVDWTYDMKEWEKSQPRDPITKRLRGDYE
jgi:hypothetical protein